MSYYQRATKASGEYRDYMMQFWSNLIEDPLSPYPPIAQWLK